MPKEKASFTLRDPTIPAPKIKKKTQLLKTKPRPNITPWRHFHPSTKTTRVPRGPSPKRPVSLKTVHQPCETPDETIDDDVTPKIVTAAELEKEASSEDDSAETVPPVVVMSKDREIIENRLKKMKKQSTMTKKVYFSHVMDVPEMLC